MEPTINITRVREDRIAARERGDVMVRGFHSNGRDTIFDVRMVNLGSETYCDDISENVLERHEKEKKNQYLQKCMEQSRYFTPLVCSCDGSLAKEFDKAVKDLSMKLSLKDDKPYSKICGMLQIRISIAIQRASSYSIRGSRISRAMMSRQVKAGDSSCWVDFSD